jgi:septum site-determining protein MinC
MAIVLTPESPLADWLTRLDEQTRRAPLFFDERPVVLDLSAMPAETDFPQLVTELKSRDLRIIGIEGVDAERLGAESWGLPKLLGGGRQIGQIDVPEHSHSLPPPPPHPSLIVEGPVRSGQSIVSLAGDVTVVGSVASGAEIIAGGSVHVYGTLRGRVIAGFAGGEAVRIFCRRLEAELLAIDGVYRTSEDTELSLRGRAIQARLRGDVLVVEPMD